MLLFAGVGAALYTFTLLATVVVEGGLPKRLERRRHARMIETFAQTTSSSADTAASAAWSRVSCCANPCRLSSSIGIPAGIAQAKGDGALAFEADTSREDVLTQVGIARARGLIAAVGTDAENVYAVLSARVMRPDLFIVGRAETEDATTKLKRAGADRVVSPYEIGGLQIAQTALRPAVVDFVELATSSDNLELAMEEITIGARSDLAQQSILDANLRQRFGVIVVGIQRRDLRMEFNPEPDTIIGGGDKLVVLGRPESLKRLETEAGGRIVRLTGRS